MRSAGRVIGALSGLAVLFFSAKALIRGHLAASQEGADGGG